MAEGWDYNKFVADMVNNMPIASIRRKITRDEALKKLADSDKCAHVFDQRKVTDRDLEIFSDDLFKYLLVRRLNITEHCSQLKRSLEDPISNFHPIIGMSVLCWSYCMQKDTFQDLENKVEIQSVDSIANYYTKKVFSLLYSMGEMNIFHKLRILASLSLELSTFCYLQGNRNAIYHGAGSFVSAFKYIFKNDFYGNGGWDAWENFALLELQFHKKKFGYVPAMDSQMIVFREWLQRFDRWIARLPSKTCPNQIELMASNESTNKSGNVNLDATCPTTYKSEKIENDAESKTKEKQLQCLYTKDCPAAKSIKNKLNYLILELIAIIAHEKDSAYEAILQIIENDTSVKILMRYCFIPRLIGLLENSTIKMRNTDILQCLKLFLKDNARMAAYCFLLVIEIHKELHKVKSFEQKDSNGKILAITSEKKEINLKLETVEHSSSIKESNSSLYQEHNKLLDSFLRTIKANDQLGTSTVSEICDIIANKNKTEILLTYNAFKVMLKTTVASPVNRWEDEWVLSVMRLLINSQTNVFTHPSTEDGAQKTEHLANKVSIRTNSQPIKSIPYSVTKTGQSLIPSTSGREDVGTEPVCEDRNAKRVENPHQNVLSFNMCDQCFNRVREKLKIVLFYPETAEIDIPETKTQENLKSSIAHEISGPKKTSTTKVSETAAIDLPSINLYSNDSSKDLKQTDYSV